MIDGIFLTNIILIALVLFVDISLGLHLENTKLNIPLCIWLFSTGVSVFAYAIYFVWGAI